MSFVEPDIGDSSPQETFRLLASRWPEPTRTRAAELFATVLQDGTSEERTERVAAGVIDGVAKQLMFCRRRTDWAAGVEFLTALRVFSAHGSPYLLWEQDGLRPAQFLAEHNYTDVLREIVDALGARTVFAPDSRSFLSNLTQEGKLDPLGFIDGVELLNDWKAVGGGSWDQNARDHMPTLPDIWAKLDPQAMAAAAYRLLDAQQDLDRVASLAWSLERSLQLRYPDRLINCSHLGPIASLLLERTKPIEQASDVLIRTAWRWARWAFEDSKGGLDTDSSERLSAHALERLGKMRTLFRSPEGLAEFASPFSQEFHHAAIFFLLRLELATPWDVLRRLILAFRELPQRATALDLRTWNEHPHRPPPEPWAWLPRQISVVLETFIGTHYQERDPDLRDLRLRLARFLIGRLKTNKDRHPLEPDPNWRHAYVRAAGALMINPGKRALGVLKWARHHDENVEVRTASERAYAGLNQTFRLGGEQSPRRHVIEAFWWLRQGHLLSLGYQPSREASRTLKRELRRSEDRAD